MQRTTSKRNPPPPEVAPLFKRVRSRASNGLTTRRRKSTVLNKSPSTRLEIFVFGEGSAGELGLGDAKNAIDVKAPRLNKNLDAKYVGVVDLSAGGMHAVALCKDNQILTWGVNDKNTLGRNTSWDGGLKDVDADNDSDSDSTSGLNPLESTPAVVPFTKFPPGTKFAQVVAGDSTTFVLTDEGLVFGWGQFRDRSGEFGFYMTPDDKVITLQKEPMLIPELKDITELSAGGDFCLALDAKGAVFAWGTGDQGQLGRRLVSRRRNNALRPTLVEVAKKKIVSIHAGGNHAFAIDINGDTWAWGLNNFAQTGVVQGAGEDGNAVFVPQRVKSLIGKNMKMVGGGSHHSIGITHSGDCYVWGRMDGAQMGLDISQLSLNDPKTVVLERGKPRILLQPTRLPVSDCIFAAAGSDHNIVITSSGKAYSWGFNATYQCGQRTTDDIPIAKLIDNSAIRDKKLCWAGAGGQYSFLASPYEDPSERIP